jgi:RNase P/RNase MRP subunit p30
VFGNGRENEFAEMAEKLGYTKLIILVKTVDALKIPLVKNKVTVKYALFIDTPNKNKVIEQVRKAKNAGCLSFVVAQNQKFDRFIVEKTGATGIVDVEFVHPKDHLHFRRSGLDQVMCRFAHEKKKIIVASFSHLLRDKRNILGRIAQNIRFCKKYDIEYLLGSFATTPLEMIGAYEKKVLLKVL